MGKLARQKEQERIGNIGDTAEEPDHDNDGGYRRQQYCQASKKIRAPTRKQVLLHSRNVGSTSTFAQGKAGV